MAFNRSLIGRVMAVAVPAALVIIAAVSAVVYVVTYREISAYRLERLEERTTERARRQEAVFAQIRTALSESRRHFQRVRERIDPDAARQRFDRAFPPHGDGSRRSRDALFDGMTDPGGREIFGTAGFVPAGARMEGDRLLDLMAAYEVVTMFGPSLHGQLPNFWFFSTAGDIVIFAPDRDDQLRPYRSDLPADFDFTGHTVARLASVENDPLRRMVCGNLNTMVYDPDGRSTVLTSSCQVPVDRPGAGHIGSFGSTLTITGWMNETVRTPDESSYRYMLVSPKHGLLAHPNVLLDGRIEAVERVSQEENIESFLPHLDGKSGTFTSEAINATVAYVRIAGPDWYLVAVQPRQVIATAATDAALQAALATGMTALLLKIVIAFLVLHLVARPVRQLADEADRDIAAGTNLETYARREDEIGRLGNALLERDRRVSSLVETLEQRVRERTAEFETARQEAEAANNAKTAFLATMSHEIRTPMNGVIGMAEALGRTGLNAEQRDFLNVMTRSGKALLALIDDILDISKIEAGKLKLEPQTVKPGEIIEEVCSLYAQTAERKGLRLERDVSAIRDATIATDALRVRQVLSNLVSNALKFTEDGSVTVTASRPAPGRIEICVADTGPGIPEAMQAAIFNKFEQAEQSTTRRFGGTGLGLAISRELVQLLGGRLEVRSRPGEGATFTFSISALETSGAEPAKLSEIGAAPTGSVAGLDLLVAEDLDVNRKVIEAICKPLGVRLTMAGNGQEAIELLARRRFDAVLMDLRMPVMDGLEATRRIRSGAAGPDGADTPIIALTANAMREHIEESLSAGADAHLAKPVSRTALVEALSRHCAAPAGSAREAAIA